MVWKRDRGREGWREPMSAYSLNGRTLFTWLTCSRFIRLWPWRVQWQFCISYASSAPTLTDLSLKLRVKTNFRIVNAFSWCKCAQTVRESALSYQRSHTHTPVHAYTFCLLSLWMDFTWSKLTLSLPHPFVPLSLSLIQLQLYPKSLMAKTVQKQAFTFDCLLVVDFSGFLACIDALNKRQMIIICAVAHSLSDFGYRTNKSCLLVACEWACCCCCYLLFCCFDMMLLCHRRRYHCLRISWAVAAAAAVAVVSFELMPSLDVQKGNRSVRQKTE